MVEDGCVLTVPSPACNPTPPLGPKLYTLNPVNPQPQTPNNPKPSKP